MKILILLLVLLLTGCSTPETKLKYKNISSKEAFQMIYVEDNVLKLIDVRTKEEYDSGHLQTAVNIPYDQIETILKDDYKDYIIIVYCQTGKRAEVAAQKLIDMGYTKVYTFGGLNNWSYSDAIVKK